MKFTELQIQNFKCIEDSNKITVDQVTCLMGKNEAGKTALLEALYKLNPVEPDMRDFDELEYPRRHVKTHRERKDLRPDNVLTTTWELEPNDIQSLEELIGPEILTSNQVTITKGYDNTRRWAIELDEKKYLLPLIEGMNFNASEKAQVTQCDTVEELIEKMDGLDSPTEKQLALVNQLRENLPEGSLSKLVRAHLGNRLPIFVFFDAYHKLPGRVALTRLKQLRDEKQLSFPDKIFLALLDMTSSSLDEVESIGESEKLIMELEAIQNSLTDQIFEYWTQNRHLDVQFRFDHSRPEDPHPFNDGYIFSTRIHNRRHRVTVNFDERSSGFIWFFSFLVWFSQVKKNYGDNIFLLLDEPGLPLHGKAQRDLLNYINKELRPNYQVIYTAHSPFLIDMNHIFSLRTVEDVVEIVEEDGTTTEKILGTKVGRRVFSRDQDTMLPLQGIVGYDLAQTMFVGPYVVVVEGPTEAALISWFARYLAQSGDESLDLRWAVCPAEGAAKVSSFVTLFKGRGLRIAALMDYHDGQKGLVDSLENSSLLEKKHLFRTSDYVSQSEADIEDFVGRELYIELVNRAMSLPDEHRLPQSPPGDAEKRVVKEVEAHCRLLPPGFREFDHYLPVGYLIELPKTEIAGLPGLEDAATRFSSLFADLNKLIQ